MFSSSYALLRSIQAALEAVTPEVQTSADDRFVCQIAPQLQVATDRQVLLTAQPARRTQGRTCNAWETFVSIEVLYLEGMDDGATSPLGIALADSEALLSALYEWSTTVDGVNLMEVDLGQIASNGQGVMVAARQLRIEFQRG